jgi:DNA-binding XRE family transcriptional regulator
LYPQYIGEELGMDSEQYDAIQKESECASEPDLDVSLDREEATFAERLRELMDKNGISQTRLAEMIGVGQPAISMMLSRSCRPQLRTVEKIAQALGVSVNSLWPDS